MTNLEPVTVARWESRSGKHTVILTRDRWGYTYRAAGASGSYHAESDDAAIAHLEPRVDDFQPDANKTPMRLVFPAR